MTSRPWSSRRKGHSRLQCQREHRGSGKTASSQSRKDFVKCFLFLFRFLLESIEDLDRSLRKLGSRLFVVRGQPADVLPKLFKEWRITTLTFEEDPELYGKERDVAITSLTKEHDVETITRISHTLYDLQ
ncbi:cryptochrome-2-like, partial [Gigantopelta aegis]|uniref:cryptochrome-2-like n=1 Tax=Gigantopelta aegis TaxID=1735272 RepID=UPI001B887B25